MEQELKFELKPKFNLFYEMFMPTGLRLARMFVFLIVNLAVIIGINILRTFEAFDKEELVNVFNGINMVTIAVFILFLIIFTIMIIVQRMQYKRISYSFYEDYLEYKDTFLNKNTKKIKYSNVREVEIQRTVMDRIMGFGKIILYTNAEKSSSSALVIFAIKNSEEEYKKIDDIIHENNLK